MNHDTPVFSLEGLGTRLVHTAGGTRDHMAGPVLALTRPQQVVPQPGTSPRVNWRTLRKVHDGRALELI